MMFQNGGLVGLLWDGKGMIFEGGMCVLVIFFWFGCIEVGVMVVELGMVLDFYVMVVVVVGVDFLDDCVIDSFDFGLVFFDGVSSF